MYQSADRVFVVVQVVYDSFAVFLPKNLFSGKEIAMSYSVNGLTCADAILVVSVGNVLSVTDRRSELPSFSPGQ